MFNKLFVGVAFTNCAPQVENMNVVVRVGKYMTFVTAVCICLTYLFVLQFMIMWSHM